MKSKRMILVTLAALAVAAVFALADEPFGRGAVVTASTRPQVVTFPGAVKTAYICNRSASVWVYVAKNATTSQWGKVMVSTNALPIPPESTLSLGDGRFDIRYVSLGTLTGTATVAIGGE
jgi:hypothetical protein